MCIRDSIQSDGSLTVEGELDRELQEFYTFRILAEDGGEKPHHTTVDVDIRVSDLNDNYPVFYNYDKLIQVRIAQTIYVSRSFYALIGCLEE